MSIYIISTSFCELDPAVGDQAIGIFGGHLDDAILSDRGALARAGLDRADPWRTSYGYAMYRFSEKASGTTPRRLTRP